MPGCGVVEVEGVLAGFAASNGEARRLIANGGLKINDAKVSDERALVTLADLDTEGRIKLAKGKTLKLAVPA